MKKSIIFIGLVLILGACILSQNTKYYFIGCIIFMTLLSMNSFKELYKYQKGRKYFDEGISLKRENLSWRLFSCIYFSSYFIVNFLISKLTIIGLKEVVMALTIIIYIIVNLYAIIWKRPILSQNGVLLSNGEFILLDNIKNANIEEDKSENNKKLIINSDKGNCILKFKNSDYEDIKKLSLIYESTSN